LGKANKKHSLKAIISNDKFIIIGIKEWFFIKLERTTFMPVPLTYRFS
jgi:hypothetical protein